MIRVRSPPAGPAGLRPSDGREHLPVTDGSAETNNKRIAIKENISETTEIFSLMAMRRRPNPRGDKDDET